MALLGHPVVEQGAQSLEEELRQIEDRQEVPALESEVLLHLARLGEQDLEVLRDRRVLLGGPAPLELGERRADCLELALGAVERQGGHLLVQPLDPEAPRGFG